MTNITIDYSTVLGRGGTATIYAVMNKPHLVAKIYTKPNHVTREKLEIVLNRLIDCETAGHLAIPIDIIGGPLGVTGYTQAYFPSDHYLPLHFWIEGKLNRRLTADQSDLLFRVKLLASLAHSISILHIRNIAVVDLKPSNILVHRDTANVAIVDCDAFCVLDEDGTSLYPAQEVTPGYCNGDALRNHIPATDLSYEQDAFAYSVIAFQLLNNRIHPFQGISFSNDDSFNIDDLVKRGIYPYGSKTTTEIRPIAHSTHDLLPPKLFEAFERSFSRRRKRIEVARWGDIFSAVLSNDLLEKCRRRKSIGLHHKFRNFPCGTCKTHDLITIKTQPDPPIDHPRAQHIPQISSSTNPPTTTPATLTGGQTSIIIAVVSIAVVIAALMLGSNSNRLSTASPTPPQDTPAPAPAPAPQQETLPKQDVSSLTNYEICRGALNSRKTGWDTYPSVSRYLSEASLRSLSIDACRKEFRLAPLAVENRLKLTSLSTSELCRYALSYTDQNWFDAYPDHVEEARRRGLSLNDCKTALNLSTPQVPDTPTPSTRTFRELSNCDIRAVDLASQSTNNSSECRTLCDENTSCEGVVFNKWENFCILKTQLDFTVFEPQADCWILSDLSVEHDRGVKWGTALKDYRFIGGTLISRSNDVSRGECEEQCDESKPCFGYNYRPASNECELLSRMDSKFVRTEGSVVNYLLPEK
jgi:serine/threonine protein kinase